MILRRDGHHDVVHAQEVDAAEKSRFGGNDIGWQALGPAIACTLLATSVVTARWFARHRLAQCLGLDDYVILISLTFSWTMTALIGAEVNGGMGMYAGPVRESTIVKLVVASNCLWILVVNITKASILIQYLRIFSSRLTRFVCYVFLTSLLPAASWAVFAGIFLCSPTEKLWEPNIPGHCMSAKTYWLSVAGIDIGLDFLILLLPLPAITSLRLPRKQKLGLVLVFTLGFSVCVVSVLRLVTVLVAANEGHHVESGVWAIIWSAVEANVGIICASLLSLKPLVLRLFPSMMDESKPSQHCMRINMIAAGDVWRDETMKVYPKSARSRRTQSTLKSNESSVFKSSSAGSSGNAQHMFEMESGSIEQRPISQHFAGRDCFTFADILQQDREERRASIQRRHSCFTEHI